MTRPLVAAAALPLLTVAALAAGSAAGAAPAGFAVPAHVASIDQAADQGARIFAHDSFGSSRTWIPAGAMDSRPMSCAACHTDGGRTEGVTPAGQHLPSLIGAAARFPRFNPRTGTAQTLQQQIAHCVRGGVGGQPPAANSPAMADLVAYLTRLSKGVPMGRQFK